LKKKKIDSVELQRSIREKLSKRYEQSREIEIKELRERFAHLRREKVSRSSKET